MSKDFSVSIQKNQTGNRDLWLGAAPDSIEESAVGVGDGDGDDDDDDKCGVTFQSAQVVLIALFNLNPQSSPSCWLHCPKHSR